MRRHSVCPMSLLALSAATLLAVSSCSKPEEVVAPPPQVEVVTIEQKDVPIYREWVGTLDGDVNATISAQVVGNLVRQNYNEGQLVKEGDLLFEIDPRPFQATLDQASAKLKKTELDVQRYTPLAATEAVSKQELDNAIQANLAAKAVVEQQKLNLQFTKITSPIEGVAGLAKAEIGDLVGPSTGLLTTVTRIDPMRAYFSIDQVLMTEIQERIVAEGRNFRTATNRSNGPSLELILASGHVYPQKGQVRFADNQLNVKTGTIRVVGEFPNPQGLLVPGMFTRIRAQLGIQTNALLVPQRAVTDMQGRSLIAVVGSDNKISIRPVTTGERIGGMWIIKGDIKAGDRVVAEGTQKVRDAIPVSPVPLVVPSLAQSGTSTDTK
jgi:RND family efflux transporter MFP subunit